MIIGIDGNEANEKSRVGIGEYSFELLQQFEKFQISNFKFQIYLKKSPLSHMPNEREGWQYKVVGPSMFWTQFALPLDLYLHKPRPDVFFTPTHYAPRFCPVPYAISIMDLSYIYYPEMFRSKDLYQLRNWTSYSAKNARKIFTISKASKDDIITIYKTSKQDVVVTYPGIKRKNLMQNSKLLKERHDISKKYILFVGTLQPRKNIVRLVEAFSIISPKNDNLQLVIVGKKGWHFEDILNSPQKFGVENSVKFLEFVSNDELETLYKNALCFVLPSLYEGFGLPVLEAMKNGCPVIVSNVSSLPEAGGQAALYINPEDVNDISRKIEMLINDNKLRETLIKKGYDQVKKFSWEKTAKQTLAVLEEIATKQ